MSILTRRRKLAQMTAPPEDAPVSHLETHQHNPSCAPMAASLERIADTLRSIKQIMSCGIILATVYGALSLIFR